MKIIKPSFTIEARDGLRGNLSLIERAARTCYKTEDAIAEGSAERMVRALMKRGHDAMLEHGDYVFLCDESIYKVVVLVLDSIMEATGARPMLVCTENNGRYIISGNIRAWRNYFKTVDGACEPFAPHFDPVYLSDIEWKDFGNSDHVKPIGYDELAGKTERLAHIRQTVRFIVDRGVSHEFVRHRVMSFAQESSRYVDYSAGKHGHEITVIEPCYLNPASYTYEVWKQQCLLAEMAYLKLRKLGCKPEEARAVLPTSAKTELVMTGTLSQWNHFFDLRARCRTGQAHPQAMEVACPLMGEMAVRFPEELGGDDG